MIISYALILPISQLQIQPVITSLIRSYIEYLIHTYHILVFILLSKSVKKLALALAGFITI